MTSCLLEGRAAPGRCQSIINVTIFKFFFACQTALKCAVTLIYLKSFDPERMFNHQHFLNVWALAAV